MSHEAPGLPKQLRRNSQNSTNSGLGLVSSIILSVDPPDRSPSLSSQHSNIASEERARLRPSEAKALKQFDTTNKVSKKQAKNNSKVAKKYFCSFCGQGFTRKHNMVSHELIHSSAKPHICTVCNCKFRRIHDLKRHEKLHTGEKPYTCEKCLRSFARPDALTRHKNSQDACSGVKSETELGPVISTGRLRNISDGDNTGSDSNTNLSSPQLPGQSGYRQSHSKTRTSHHTYRQPYSTTTTTTTTTTRRYEDPRANNGKSKAFKSRHGSSSETPSLPIADDTLAQNPNFTPQPDQSGQYWLLKSHSPSQKTPPFQQLPPVQRLDGGQSSHTSLPSYSQIIGEITSPDQSNKSLRPSGWQQHHRNVHRQELGDHYQDQISSLPPSFGQSQQHTGNHHADSRSGRISHHLPLILNTYQLLKPTQLECPDQTQNLETPNINIPRPGQLDQRSTSIALILTNTTLGGTTNGLVLNGLERLNALNGLVVATELASATPDASPGYPYLHEQLNSLQNSMVDNKDFVTLAKYQDLVHYAQSLQDSMSKMNVRLKLLEGERSKSPPGSE